MSKKMRFLSFILAIAILISSAPAVPVYAEEEASVSAELTNPFRSDVSFTVDGKSFTSNSYRIPSMVTLADGTIVAAADIRWNTTYDGGGLDTLVARSTDGGKTWSYTTANYLGDNGNEYNGSSSAAFLDPSLVVGADGKTVYMLVDLYPYGVALNGSGHTNPSTDVGFNDQGKLLLSGDNHNSYSYYLDGNKIYTSTGTVVEGYSVDEKFNITGNGIESNLFFKDSPFKVVRTGYLYLTSSTDGGASWSAPTLLNNIKTTSEQVCLIAPGNSITTSDGTMIFPVYSFHGDNNAEGNTQRLSFIYSKDGINWSRTEELDHNWASEAAVVELQDGTLRFFIRNGAKKLCYVDYNMENGWGSVVTLTDINTNSNTQISAITYSKTSNGKQVVLVSCPTGPNRKGSNSSSASNRLNGSIFVLTVDSNGDMKLESTIHVNENNNQFMYSCLTERSDGSVLILFENKENGWGTGDNCFYTMDIKGYLPSALGIPLDAPQNIIVDEKGNIVDSITLGQYEKPELTANAPFSTADVDYQWQIEYEDGKWVDIYGEDSKTVRLSLGMVATLLGDEGKVDIRCKTTAGTQVVYSKPITVTVEMYQPEEPDVVVTDSFITSSGETVTVSVAGALPEDASVQLGETDSTGVDVKPSETVVAALDISIKNADGTEWQPASGETVTVTLEASKIGLKNGDEFVVYHLHNGEVRVLGSYKVVNDTVSFEVDGFSKFVFTLAEQTVFSDDLQSNIGKTATINDAYDYFSAVADPNVEEWSMAIEGEDYPAGIEFIITDVHVSSTYPYNIYYKVKIKDDEVLNDFLSNYPWIYQGHQDEDPSWGTLILHDNTEEPEEPSVCVTVDGEKVTEITIDQTTKVTVNAKATFNTADIDYKWQICYDAQNDLWVDITGENEAEISVSAGMVISLMDENNQVRVRCVATAGSQTLTSDSILVTLHIEESDGEDVPELEILLDGESADSVDVYDAEKDSFAPILSANTNLPAELTYTWEVLYKPDYGMWKTLSKEATLTPVFGSSAAGTYIGNANYVHSSAITIRLTVSDGVTTLSDTFVINLKSEAEEATPAVYSHMARSASSSSSNSGIATAAETTTTYNVIIKYMDENGQTPVADPYTSVVSPTTILTNTISFPNVPGFEPHVYKNGNWVRQDTYTFDGKPFSSDFTLEVRYFPGQVEYKVNIYIQNAENDEYVLMDSFTDTELTGTVLDKIEFTIPGYYQSKFSSNHAAIAADGSTEFNLYYDRIYYLMKFDLDGGYGVQPVYARHGVKLDIPNPTKAGYTFVGWDQTEGTPAVSNELLNDGIANTLYVYMPTGDTAYKAIWKAVDNAKVTIVYWGENPNDEKYSYLESQELYVKPGTTLTFGADQLVCTLTPHTHGSGCTYNCGITPHTHTLEAGCYKLTCTTESHNHTESGCTLNCTHSHELGCYSVSAGELLETTKPNKITSVSGNGIYTYSENWPVVGSVTFYYLYLDGKWYCAEIDLGLATITSEITLSCTHGHTNLCWSCGLNEGTHVHSVEQNCYTITCQTKAHTHSDTCYSCIAHTHNDDCYLKTTNQDPNLWTFVKSDTVTVAADGSTVMNVYYDRTTFTMTFKAEGSNGKTLGTITKKWGAKILTEFKTISEANTYFWSLKQNGGSPWTSFMDIMPAENRTYYADPQSGSSTITAKYLTQTVDGTDYEVVYTVSFKGSSTITVTKEEFVEIKGFIFNDSLSTDTGSYYNGAKFYYDRARFNLEFNNGAGVVKTESVLYEANLGSYGFTPSAPSKYEAGSVVFAGWYLNPECTGEEVKLDQMTMPAENMILYAKWVPVKHDVTVYRYRDADGTLHDLLCNHTDAAIGNVSGLGSISHGELLNKHYIPEDPTNGNYTFVTWAYYDEDTGKEVAIDINNFVVTEDVEIYAKWSSNVQIPYTIKYMINGTTTEIAEATTGKHYAGETHTFNAKTAGQLGAGYQTGYFPTVTSHSIDFKAEDNSYEYIFYYVKKDAVPYTVYYVTDQQNAAGTLTPVTIQENGVGKTYYIVADTKEVETVNAIVTENFKTVSGYMPDAYQKTLIIDGSDGATNQIIFKYSVDTTHTYYKVTHYTEQLDGSWFAHATYENIGTIGDTIKETPMDITGFTYRNTEYKVGENAPTDVNNPLTAEGLEINLYYTRNKYPYTVEYRLQGTTTVLYRVPNLEDQYYGATVSHTAPQYWGDGDVYERVSAETLSTTIQTDASKNVITFYYVEREVTIKYEVANGFGGTVNPSQETVLIKSKDADGSTAEPLSNAYKFVGWYDKTGKLISTDKKFAPAKVNGLNVPAIYYAKFEYNLTSLTIKKDGVDSYSSIDPNQTFIFNIKGDGVDLDVTVHRDANGKWFTTIDGLTVGATYTITEKTNWSWRYEYASVALTNATLVKNVANGAEITLGLDGTITFTNTRNNEQWLDGDSWCNNIFQ